MTIPDVQLIVHAHNPGVPEHDSCRAWWEDLLNGTEEVGLLDVVLFAFLRLTTNPRIFVHPYSVDEAWTEMQQWLTRPCVVRLTGNSNDLPETVDLLRKAGTAGNLVTDAQIAVAALARGATVHTLDSDFARFPGLVRLNPVTGETLSNP